MAIIKVVNYSEKRYHEKYWCMGRKLAQQWQEIIISHSADDGESGLGVWKKGVGGQASDRGHQPMHTAVRDEGQQEGRTRKSDQDI